MVIDVLVVDDSALMRRHLSSIFEHSEQLFSLRFARNGEHALAQIKEQKPDVVTLDINMPGMDGLDCLAHIMNDFPVPVVMVSSLTEKGAMATLEALELGAVDYVEKPGGTVSHNLADISQQLTSKVLAAAAAKPHKKLLVNDSARQPEQQPQQSAEQPINTQGPIDGVIIVGVSTGGPGTLEQLFEGITSDLNWPLVIAQHMPATFTKVLSERLNKFVKRPVIEVRKPTPLQPGHIYMAQGDKDIEIKTRGGKLMAVPVPIDPSLPWHPSVDRLMYSAMQVLPAEQLIGVLLTGMGDDGATAFKALYDKGGYTIAESEASCVVYGMPRALIELDGASEVANAADIGQRVLYKAQLKQAG